MAEFESYSVCNPVDETLGKILALYAKASKYGAHHVTYVDGQVELTFKRKKDANKFGKKLAKIENRKPPIGFQA